MHKDEVPYKTNNFQRRKFHQYHYVGTRQSLHPRGTEVETCNIRKCTFPIGPSTPKFQTRSERRRQEVEEWLEEAWEDNPTNTLVGPLGRCVGDNDHALIACYVSTF